MPTCYGKGYSLQYDKKLCSRIQSCRTFLSGCLFSPFDIIFPLSTCERLVIFKSLTQRCVAIFVGINLHYVSAFGSRRLPQRDPFKVVLPLKIQRCEKTSKPQR